MEMIVCGALVMGVLPHANDQMQGLDLFYFTIGFVALYVGWYISRNEICGTVKKISSYVRYGFVCQSS